jgi:hypothetical protein
MSSPTARLAMNRPKRKVAKAVAISAIDRPEREADTPIAHPVAAVAVDAIAEVAVVADETVVAAVAAVDATVANNQP